MDAIVSLLLLFLVVWFFWSGIRCKEIACQKGEAFCKRNGVQFLDQTVERRDLRLIKDPRNNPCWFRSFNFEFATDGEYRYQGKIEMHGHHLKSIEMEPYPDQSIEPLI